MAILSLALTVFRSRHFILGLGMSGQVAPENAFAEVFAWQLRADAVLVILGLAANTLILMRRKIGFVLGWCLVVCVIGSIGLTIWEFQEMVKVFFFGHPQRAPYETRLLLSGSVRVVILIGYIVALILGGRSLKNHASNESPQHSS